MKGWDKWTIEDGREGDGDGDMARRGKGDGRKKLEEMPEYICRSLQ